MPRYDLICPDGHEQLNIVHSIKEPHPNCPECNKPTETLWRTYGAFHAGDELQGYAARHGVCWPDGTPRIFYSKTELKRALNEKNLSIEGDTPKPYKVKWAGREETP